MFVFETRNHMKCKFESPKVKFHLENNLNDIKRNDLE